MKPFFQTLAPRAFSLIFAASVSVLGACSTGTQPGDTNVEDGSAKDKDPANRNPEHNQNEHADEMVTDTSKAYERSQQTPYPAKDNHDNHEGHNH